MNKGQEELFNKLLDNLHTIHQDIVGKLAVGDSLNSIISQLEEMRLELQSQLDDHDVVLAGNKHHQGLREVIQELQKEVEELKTTKGKKKKQTAKELGIGGGVVIAIIETIEYLKQL